MDTRALMLDALCELIRIPSVNPPGGEEPVARALAARLEALGARVALQPVEPGRPNVVGWWELGPGPAFLLTSHMDVVPAGAAADLFTPRVEASRVWGRGACDAKGQLAAMLAACAALTGPGGARGPGPPGPPRGRRLGGTLIFAGVVGEEASGVGSRHLATQGLAALGLRPAAAVVGEPTSCRVVTGDRGFFRATVRFLGRAAHSSDPDQGSNAIYSAAAFCLAVRDYHRRLQRRGDPRRDPRLGAPTASANVIAGGTKANVIPEQCDVTVDRRMPPGERPEDVRAEIEDLLRELAADDPALRWQFVADGTGGRPGSLVDEAAPIVAAARRAVASVTGSDAPPSCYRAGTDLGFFLRAGIPAVILGPGTLDDAHTDAESVAVEELEAAAAIYAAIGREVLAAG